MEVNMIEKINMGASTKALTIVEILPASLLAWQRSKMVNIENDVACRANYQIQWNFMTVFFETQNLIENKKINALESYRANIGRFEE